jgi:hypothetical protein
MEIRDELGGWRGIHGPAVALMATTAQASEGVEAVGQVSFKHAGTKAELA